MYFATNHAYALKPVKPLKACIIIKTYLIFVLTGFSGKQMIRINCIYSLFELSRSPLMATGIDHLLLPDTYPS